MFIVIFTEHLKYAGIGWRKEVIESSQQPYEVGRIIIAIQWVHDKQRE